MVSRQSIRQTNFLLFLLIASFGVFFAAALTAFLIIRLTATAAATSYSWEIPPLLFWNLLLAFLSSVCLHRAMHYVRREQIAAFQRCLFAALTLGICFFAFQTYSLLPLLKAHWAMIDGRQNAPGMVASLVFFHAAHFVIAIGLLVYVITQALRNRYDHEYHRGPWVCGVCWHFMAVVWFAMIAVFWLTP